MAWVRESEERGDCEVVPRFRLVRRHWLAWWRAFHTVKGPRPPALGDHATALRCRCLQNNNNNGGDDAAARAPLWVDRVFLSRPRHHDCQDQAAACAAVAEACDQAQTIDGSVFDVAREAATLSATLVPDADPLTLADSAPADDDVPLPRAFWYISFCSDGRLAKRVRAAREAKKLRFPARARALTRGFFLSFFSKKKKPPKSCVF